MSTTTPTIQATQATQATKVSVSVWRHWAAVNDDFAALALFCALGLLASFYVMTHFPAEDFLAAWL
jgi:hypothetical protein